MSALRPDVRSLAERRRSHVFALSAQALLSAVLLALLSGCPSTGREVRLTTLPEATTVAPAVSAETLVAEGFELLAANRAQEAVERLAQGIEAGGETPVARYKLAIGLSRLGRVREAAESAERAFALSSDAPYVAALDLAVRAWVAAGDAQHAVGLARDAAEEDRDNLSYQNILHRAMIGADDLSAVLRDARDVLKKDETNLGAMRNLAACYLKMGKLENASYILKQALEIRPDAELYLLMARIHITDKDVTGAIHYLQKAVEENPTFVEGLSDLGALYAQVGDAQTAIDELRRAIEIAPGVASLYLHLGNGLRGLQQYTEANEAYQKALSIDPTMAEAHYNLGILYLENQVQGMDGEARLQRSIDEFNEYRQTKRASASRDEEIDGFIAEAKELIKIERQRREEAQKQPEPQEEEPQTEEPQDEEPQDEEPQDGEPQDGEPQDEEPQDETTPPTDQLPPTDAAPEVEPASLPEPVPAAEPAPLPEPVPVVEPAPLPEPVPVVEPAPLPEPVPVVEPAPLPEPAPAAEPVPLPEPQ